MTTNVLERFGPSTTDSEIVAALILALGSSITVQRVADIL